MVRLTVPLDFSFSFRSTVSFFLWGLYVICKMLACIVVRGPKGLDSQTLFVCIDSINGLVSFLFPT